MPRIDDEIVNFDHPDSLDTALMIAACQQLQRGEPANIPIYDFTTHSRTDRTSAACPAAADHPDRGHPDFCRADLTSAVRRTYFRRYRSPTSGLSAVSQRDVAERGRTLESVIHQYLTSVRPMHLEFVEPSKRYADVIIPEGGHNLVAIEMVADRIRSIMQAANRDVAG